jgi:flagella basal body P-ring formation protein FlgA
MNPIALLALAAAAPFADPAQLDAAVVEFTGSPLGVPGGAAQPVDRRLKLASCRNPLGLSWYAGRRDAVLVQCPDAGGWRIFVPILQSAADQTPAILRGEAVTIQIAGDGFAVTQAGQALDPGALNSWIRVKTSSADAQPLRARVVRPGLVRVDLGNDLP